MVPVDRNVAVGVFTDQSHAALAVEELRRNGFSQEQIGYLVPDQTAKVEVPPQGPGTKTVEGATVGVAAGAALGGILGAALATVALPGVGLVIAGGILAGLLGGAVTGAASGGLLGALVGLDIPEEEARHYEREFHSGRTLVTVRVDGRYDEAVAILQHVQETANVEPPRHAKVRLADEGGGTPGSGSGFVPGA